MASIQKVSDEVKAAIKRKSAYSLPNNPTAAGFKASDIRNAFYRPIVDVTHSALTELDRVAEEINAELDRVDGVVTEIHAELDRVDHAVEQIHAELQTPFPIVIGTGKGALLQQSSEEDGENQALTAFSSAFGQGNLSGSAGTECQFLCGKYSKVRAQDLFAVGNGSAQAPANAFSVSLDGTASVGADPTHAMDVVTKQYLEKTVMGLPRTTPTVRYLEEGDVL